MDIMAIKVETKCRTYSHQPPYKCLICTFRLCYFKKIGYQYLLPSVIYSQGLADNAVISKVNGEVWDLDRPLEDDTALEILRFDNEEAQQVFWHSSAHMLGEALERIYGGCLCYGPPIENGFYYDMFLENKYVHKCCEVWVKNLKCIF